MVRITLRVAAEFPQISAPFKVLLKRDVHFRLEEAKAMILMNTSQAAILTWSVEGFHSLMQSSGAAH